MNIFFAFLKMGIYNNKINYIKKDKNNSIKYFYKYERNLDIFLI